MEGVFRVSKHIRNVDNSALMDCTPDQATSIGCYGRLSQEFFIFTRKTATGGEAENLRITKKNVSVVGVAKPRRRFNQSIEYCLQIKSRAADDLQHIGGCGLLLQPFRESLHLPPLLVEQYHLLHRNLGFVRQKLWH